MHIAIVTFDNLLFTRMCLASLLINTEGPDVAQPEYWAPFVLVGEGAT